jgi:hypothetical protein
VSSFDSGLAVAQTDSVSDIDNADLPGSTPTTSMVSTLLHPVLACVVFLAHVSLWNDEFLEEIGLARAWQLEGIHGFRARIDLVIARPLLLLPSYVGLVLSNGGVHGMYLVLGLVVAGQYFAAVWATRPLIPSRWVRAAFGLCVALHPLWPAGWTLRFLAYQVSVLAIVVWAGCTIRFLRQQHSSWILIVGCIVLSLGLLHVQSLMLVPLVALIAVGCYGLASESPDLDVRRWSVGFAATVVTVIANLTYSIVIAPHLSSTTYESEVSHYTIGGIETAGRQLYRTSLANTPFLVTYVVLLAAGVAALGVALARGRQRVLGIIAVLVAALLPLVALVYSGTVGHTRDPDRVLAPCSVAAVVVGWVVVSRLRLPRIGFTALALAVASTIGLSGFALADWHDRGSMNRELLAEVTSTIAAAAPGTRFVVIDSSGQFGDVYSFLPPHLQLAVTERLDREVDVQLCTADGVARHHPDAARYPISTTPDCSAVLKAGEGSIVQNIVVEGSSLTIVAVPVAPG